MNNYITRARTLKKQELSRANLAPVAAQEVVVLTAHGAASDDEAGSMTTPRALNEGEL